MEFNHTVLQTGETRKKLELFIGLVKGLAVKNDMLNQL
jgi:hypothetical protein